MRSRRDGNQASANFALLNYLYYVQHQNELCFPFPVVLFKCVSPLFICHYYHPNNHVTFMPLPTSTFTFYFNFQVPCLPCRFQLVYVLSFLTVKQQQTPTGETAVHHGNAGTENLEGTRVKCIKKVHALILLNTIGIYAPNFTPSAHFEYFCWAHSD